MTSTQQTKPIDRRFIEAINTGNLDRLAALLAPDFVDHNLPPGLPPGRAGVTQFFSAFRAAFPDLAYTVEDQITDGNMLVQRVSGRGTMQGAFQGMPATGKQATWSEIHIIRLADGQYAEHWGSVDQLGMLQQLGVIATPAPAR
jgi:steroid delta-isomerase-like uncharacterized protein